MTKKENPNAFKHAINKSVLTNMAASIKKVYPTFDEKLFVSINRELEKLELKARVRLVREQLKTQLPKRYSEALEILLKSLQSNNLSGFDLWPYTEFIQTYGLDDFSLSLNALYKITELFTAEFAVRPFLKKYPTETLAYLKKCSTDANVHIRRWASEGSRSRLPWGERLDDFIKDHKPTIPILENLKFDSELYVRKSVSNHLNDMAKDHPELVIQILKKWQANSSKEHEKKIDWIIRRALRTLIKDGNPKALELVGASQNLKIKVSPLKLNKTKFKMNERIEFDFQITSGASKDQKLVVDYIIHFVKANKTTAPKVFKLKNLTLKPKEKLRLTKKHHLKPVTTRVYHSGVHFIQIQINGKTHSKVKWVLG